MVLYPNLFCKDVTEITIEIMASVVETMVAADLTVRLTASIKKQPQQHRKTTRRLATKSG